MVVLSVASPKQIPDRRTERRTRLLWESALPVHAVLWQGRLFARLAPDGGALRFPHSGKRAKLTSGCAKRQASDYFFSAMQYK